MENEAGSGRLTVIGTGPGAVDQMTVEAIRAIEECDLLVGYQVYIDLVRDRFPDKEIVTTPMRRLPTTRRASSNLFQGPSSFQDAVLNPPSRSRQVFPARTTF